MKLFGQQLFQKSRVGTLYDFAQHGLLNGLSGWDSSNNVVSVQGSNVGTMGAATVTNFVTYSNPVQVEVPNPTEKKPNQTIKRKITPKELWQLKALNVEDLHIISDKGYLDEEIETLRKKLELVGDKASGGAGFGHQEIESMITRLENRYLLHKYSKDFEAWPHTTSQRMHNVIKSKGNEHLRCKLAAEFIPDFPKEAVDEMTKYTELTKKLCGRSPVFYVIADAKDFGEVNKKRDPILLAQSPFGFFWQVLGAWDEEMILLGEL